MKLAFSLISFAFMALSSYPFVFAQIPKPSMEAVGRCEDCGDDSKLPYIQVGAKAASGKFPLAKCNGVRNDSHGKGGWLTSRSHGSHTGIDWMAKPGTQIISPWPGKVTLSKKHTRAAGYTIKITHDNGYKTVYMHLGSDLKVSKNAHVKAGQVIGESGTSGNAGAKGMVPHLHFELFNPKGQRIDPTSVFGCK